MHRAGGRALSCSRATTLIPPHPHPSFVMKIFKDIISEDELCSDSYPMQLIHDGLIIEVETKQITRSKVGNIDIGANPSAEEGGEEEGADGDNDKVTVNNLVDAHQLVETSYDKKSYMGHIKGYLKALVEKQKANGVADADIKAFQSKAQAFVVAMAAKFDDYAFYTGQNMDPEAMVVLKVYKEDGVIPYFLLWKAGIREEKY